MNALRQETTLRLAAMRDRSVAAPSAATTPSPSGSSLSAPPRPPLPFRVPQSFHGLQLDAASLASPLMTSSAVTQDALPSPQDPIWEFDEGEMMRLCKIYEEEVGAMYPAVDVSRVKQHAKATAAWMSARRDGLVPPQGLERDLLDLDTLLLKAVLCCALAVEEHANSAKAARLYDSIQPTIDRMLMTEPADVSRLPFLAVCAGYRHLCHDEGLSWRVRAHVLAVLGLAAPLVNHPLPEGLCS